MSFWKSVRHRIEWLGVALLAALAPRLSRRGCVRLGNILGAAYYHLDARARAVSDANLAAAFGDAMSPARRREIAKLSLQNFARMFLDLFWARNLTPGNFSRHIHQENFEHLLAAKKSLPAPVFFCHHFGNFEWLMIGVGFAGGPVCFVAQEFKNPLLDPFFIRAREVSGCTLIPRQGAVRKLFRVARDGPAIGVLIDLTLRPEMPSVVIETFGGLKMCVTHAHATLHKRFGCPLLPNVSLPQPDGSCRTLHFPPVAIPPEATEQEIAQACWDSLEPFIHEHPELWMWAYKHWRYLPKDATRRYPYYARASGKFEKLLRRSNRRT